jgi:hypothetical protein
VGLGHKLLCRRPLLGKLYYGAVAVGEWSQVCKIRTISYEHWQDYDNHVSDVIHRRQISKRLVQLSKKTLSVPPSSLLNAGLVIQGRNPVDHGAGGVSASYSIT